MSGLFVAPDAVEAPNPFIEHPSLTRDCNGGEQFIFRFANGLGASVVRHPYSYGGDAGLWELGVLGADGDLSYDTPITDDVLGYLSVVDVRETLRRIAELPAVS